MSYMRAEIYFNRCRELSVEQHKALVGWLDENLVGLQDGWEGDTTVLDYRFGDLPYYTTDLADYVGAARFVELASSLGVDVVVFCDEHDEPLATEMEVGAYLLVSSRYFGVFEMSACRNSRTPLLHAVDFLPDEKSPLGGTNVRDELKKALFCLNMTRPVCVAPRVSSYSEGQDAEKVLEMLNRLAAISRTSALDSTGEPVITHYFCATGLEMGYHAPGFPHPVVVFYPGREWSQDALERVGFDTAAAGGTNRKQN